MPLQRFTGQALSGALIDLHAGVRCATAPMSWKVPDAWDRTLDNLPLFAGAVTHAVVYIVRNPLDVAISLRHHLVVELDAAGMPR